MTVVSHLVGHIPYSLQSGHIPVRKVRYFLRNIIKPAHLILLVTSYNKNTDKYPEMIGGFYDTTIDSFFLEMYFYIPRTL